MDSVDSEAEDAVGDDGPKPEMWFFHRPGAESTFTAMDANVKAVDIYRGYIHNRG